MTPLFADDSEESAFRAEAGLFAQIVDDGEADPTTRAKCLNVIGQEVRMLARAHQSLVWSRQRQANQLRSLLREYYPGALDAFGDDLVGRDALAVLRIAPTPTAGRKLTVKRIEAVLRKAGRQRYLAVTAQRIHEALHADQLPVRAGLEHAYGASARSLIAVITTMVAETATLQGEVEAVFRFHPRTVWSGSSRFAASPPQDKSKNLNVNVVTYNYLHMRNG